MRIVPIGSGSASLFSTSAAVAIAALGLLVGSIIQLFAAAQASFRSSLIGAENRKLRLIVAGVTALFLGLVVIFLPFLSGFLCFCGCFWCHLD